MSSTYWQDRGVFLGLLSLQWLTVMFRVLFLNGMGSFCWTYWESEILCQRLRSHSGLPLISAQARQMSGARISSSFSVDLTDKIWMRYVLAQLMIICLCYHIFSFNGFTVIIENYDSNIKTLKMLIFHLTDKLTHWRLKTIKVTRLGFVFSLQILHQLSSTVDDHT